MLILWIRRHKKGKKTNPTKNYKDSFQKHAEDMKKFRHSHQELETIISKDIITRDGIVLAPVDSVQLPKHIQN